MPTDFCDCCGGEFSENSFSSIGELIYCPSCIEEVESEY